MSEGYEGLSVYRKAYKMVVRTYEIVKSLPKEELFGMSSQMRRAAMSVPLNIAEGYSRKDDHPKEYRNYLQIAKGSCYEMQVLLKLGVSLGYFERTDAEQAWNSYDEIGKMLYGIIKTLGDKP